MGKSSPSAPAAPDYAAAATAQGVANEATARLQGRMNNPNVIGPLGSQTVTFGTPTFNQAGYDQAMSAYSGQPQRGAAPTLGQFTTTDEGDESTASRTSVDQAGYSQAMANWANSGVGGPAPTREQFTTNANPDQPTVTQTLTPAAQATLDAQQRVQRALAGLGEQGIGTASTVLGNAFNPNLPGIQTNVGSAGRIPQLMNLSSYGQASGNINARPISQAPELSAYGMACRFRHPHGSSNPQALLITAVITVSICPMESSGYPLDHLGQMKSHPCFWLAFMMVMKTSSRFRCSMQVQYPIQPLQTLSKHWTLSTAH